MRYLDISVGIKTDMLVWPGDDPVKVSWAARIEDGEEPNVSSLEIGAHVGTHIDMPLHFIEGGANLDSLDLDRLIGLALVVEVPDYLKVIDHQFLEGLNLRECKRLLFKTSNSRLWQNPQLKFYKDYVAVDPSGAKWLVEHGCELVGIDYLSIAPYDQSQEPHEILLSNGVIVLESINLDQVPTGAYELICLPLKLEGREASPVRAILKIIE